MDISDVQNAPWRISVRPLALVTLIFGILAQTTATVIGAGGPRTGVVIAQSLWNSAQIGLLLTVFCLWATLRWRSIFWIGMVVVAILPMSLYVTGPGCWPLIFALILTCGFALRTPIPPLEITLVTVDKPGRRILTFELIALFANLLCSIYNFAASTGLFPYWSTLFDLMSQPFSGIVSMETVARGLYWLSLDKALPQAIITPSPASFFGSFAFAAIWAVLPFVYVVYFTILMKIAAKSPGTAIQRAFCLFGIFHFLFLTDVVDYRFGRGYANEGSQFCHFMEVFAWRIAVLLPIYQKVMSRDWLDGNGRLGVAVHYLMGLWGIGWFVWEFLLLDLPRFVFYAAGWGKFVPITIFGFRPEFVGYHGALLLLVFLYTLMVWKMRCNAVMATPQAEG